MKKHFSMLATAACILASCSSDDASATSTNDTQTPGQTENQQQPGEMAKRMLELVNKVRAEGCDCGGQNMPPVPSLSYNTLLEEAAQKHSEDSVKNGIFGHTGSDGSDLGTRITRVGYKFRAAGENVAGGQKTVEEVMNSWLKSPGHCKNIMNPAFKEAGFGKATDSSPQKSNHWTQVFATKL